MRPVSLRIQGFTCFSDPVEVDFRGLDVFAVTGPTGAGKTTLVDALSYALYGRVPRYDDKMTLISHNRDTMSVQLEFEAGAKSYRVHRGINRAPRTRKRVLSPVQLEVRDGDEWQPLADRVRSIDEEIVRIVGLDFKSFTSCVLLPQGRFQEFLAGDKKDRRQVLIDLLDIGIYEQIMIAANARGGDLAREAESIGRRLREDYADATPAALACCRADLHAAQGSLEVARGQRDALAEALTLARTVVDARLRQREREEQRVAALSALEAAKALALEGQTRVAALRAQVSETSRELEGIEYSAERHTDLRVALKIAKNISELGDAIERAERDARDRDALAAASVALARQAQERQSAAEAAVVAATERLRQAERQDAASHLRQGLKPGDTCPVCGVVVGAMADEPAPDRDAIDAALQAARRAEKEGREAVLAAEKLLAAERQRAESQAEQLERMREGIGRGEAELLALLPAGLRAEASSIEARVGELDTLFERRDGLAKRLTALRREHDELAPRVAASDQEIARLEAQAQQLQKEAVAASDAAEAAKRDLLELSDRWQWPDILALVESRQDPRRQLTERHAAAQNEAESLAARATALEGEAERIEKAIERAAALQEEMARLKQRSDLYRELGRLLRANAFQSFVIEEAMVSLAANATRHLEALYSRFALTVADGEFQVIDHWQADQVRPARTLSGGETFAASLALALALTERIPELRRVAATTLDSLFLDEGFGTLDQATLETVISTLEGLRSQERLVGIITHVPELARRIECRIEVQKSPAGSSLIVVGA